MRRLSVVLILSLATGVLGQAPDKLAKRYTYEVDEEKYPQKTPQEGLHSVVKAIANKKLDYLLAHLADPEYVDAKVARYTKLIDKGKEEGKTLLAFQRLLNETQEHFLEDPELIQELRRFAKESEWKMEENVAVGSVKNLVGRHVFMKKMGERWFLEQRQR